MSELESLSGQGAAGYNLAYLGVPGVRFNPTDEELIVDYLQRKLRGEPPVYADAVNDEDDDVYSQHPSDLVRNLRKCLEGSWYLFSPRDRKYPGGGRPKRGTDDDVGFWKSMGAKVEVLGGVDGKQVIGYKCSLTYHEFIHEPGSEAKPAAKRPRKPTEWKMLEFISVDTDRPSDKTAANNMLLNNYVLCKITNRKRSLGIEVRDPGLSQSTEEDGQGTPPSDGGGASQGQQQPTPGEGPAEPQDEQQQATMEAPIDGDAAAALPRGFALGANANTLEPLAGADTDSVSPNSVVMPGDYWEALSLPNLDRVSIDKLSDFSFDDFTPGPGD